MDHVRYMYVGGLLHPQRGATITLADEASIQCYFDEKINTIQCMYAVLSECDVIISL